jgi:hypothetical protein
MAGTGFEVAQDLAGDSTTNNQSGAKSGAVGVGSYARDPELNAVTEAWPDLSPAIKAGILAMIRATSPHR